jgi:hypothetical protein
MSRARMTWRAILDVDVGRRQTSPAMTQRPVRSRVSAGNAARWILGQDGVVIGIGDLGSAILSG